MFTLKNYLQSVLELLENESSSELQKEIITNWLKTLKRHHRESEMPKLLQLLNEEIERRKEKISILVANNSDKDHLKESLTLAEDSVDWEINPQEIGGAKIIWQNHLYNNTIRSQFNRLDRKLSEKL